MSSPSPPSSPSRPVEYVTQCLVLSFFSLFHQSVLVLVLEVLAMNELLPHTSLLLSSDGDKIAVHRFDALAVCLLISPASAGRYE